MVDWSDVTGAFGVAISGIGATLAWIQGLGIITVLFSVSFGSLLTFVVQSRTQKNAWKREAGLRKMDEVYGPLYEQINVLAPEFSPDTPLNSFSRYSEGPDTAWGGIRQGYRYYLIDTDLRKELDEFFAVVKERGALISGLNPLIEEKLLPRLRTLYGPDVTSVTFGANAALPNGSRTGLSESYLYGPVLARETPLEFLSHQYGGLSDYRLQLSIQRMAKVEKVVFDEEHGPPVTDPEDVRATLKEFNALVENTAKEVDKDPMVVRIRDLTKKAREQSSILKETLRIKIEQPWKV